MSQSSEGAAESGQRAAQQLEGLALQALEAVPTSESAPLWVAAYEKAAALGSKCCRLNQCLLRQLTPMTTGPLRVSPGFSVQLVYMVMLPSSL